MKFPMLVFLGLLLTHSVCAGELFGTVEAVSGTATVSDAGGTSKQVTNGLKIQTGQSIQTAADGEVHIVTADSGFIALRPNSSFRIDRYQAKGDSSDEIVFSLFKGALRSITGWIAKRNPAVYRLNTPTATIGVRGTDHETTVIETASGNDLPGTFDTVLEGATVMHTRDGSIEIRAGEHAFASREPGIAPRLLASNPDFMSQRVLKLESRIQQRKDTLQQNIRHQLDDRPQNSGELEPDIKQREPKKQHIEHRARARRNL
jgi:hypothetical protein